MVERQGSAEETPRGIVINENTTRNVLNERLFIDSDRRPGLTIESYHYGVFSPTGETMQLKAGQIGYVVNYLGGADSLEEALKIADEGAASLTPQQQALFS